MEELEHLNGTGMKAAKKASMLLPSKRFQKRSLARTCVFSVIKITVFVAGFVAVTISLEMISFFSKLNYRLLLVEADICDDPMPMNLLIVIDNPSTVSVEIKSTNGQITKNDTQLASFNATRIMIGNRQTQMVSIHSTIALESGFATELSRISVDNFTLVEAYDITLNLDLKCTFMAGLALSFSYSTLVSWHPHTILRRAAPHEPTCPIHLPCLYTSAPNECCDALPPQFTAHDLALDGRPAHTIRASINATLSLHGLAVQADGLELELVHPTDPTPLSPLAIAVITASTNSTSSTPHALHGAPRAHTRLRLDASSQSPVALAALLRDVFAGRGPTTGSRAPVLQGRRPAAAGGGTPTCALQRHLQNLSLSCLAAAAAGTVTSPSNSTGARANSTRARSAGRGVWESLSAVVSDVSDAGPGALVVRFSVRNPTVLRHCCSARAR
jgi:hypothetical protein